MAGAEGAREKRACEGFASEERTSESAGEDVAVVDCAGMR